MRRFFDPNLWRRSARFWWQRRWRGWDDSETWSLDHTLALWLAPRLKRFQEFAVNTGRPCVLETNEEWNQILTKLVSTFELIARDSVDLHEYEQEIREGLELFARWYRDLWW